MQEFSIYLAITAGIIAIISVFAFFIGLTLVCFKSSREKGQKLLINSSIIFLIGFGTCSGAISIM